MFYTVFAMVGAFSFAATESLRSIYFEIQSRIQDRIFSSPQDYCIECAAEGPALTAAKGNLSKGGFQRFVSPPASSNYGTKFSTSSCAIISTTQFIDLKNTIQLKLRI
jgi:hypothetical protein